MEEDINFWWKRTLVSSEYILTRITGVAGIKVGPLIYIIKAIKRERFSILILMYLLLFSPV